MIYSFNFICVLFTNKTYLAISHSEQKHIVSPVFIKLH